MADNDTVTGKPAYASWKTFYSFVGKLKDTAIPPTIDASVMKGMSGSAQSQVRIALRWLGLVDLDDHTSDKLEKLVMAHGSPDWIEVLGDVIHDAYTVLIGDLDLDNGTGTQLATKFRQYNMSGETLAKGVRFYLNALDSANLTYSPHFAPPHVERKKASKPKNNEGGRGKEPGGRVTKGRFRIDPIEGMILQTFTVPGRDDPIQVSFPWGLKAEEWDMVHGFMQGFIKLRTSDDDE